MRRSIRHFKPVLVARTVLRTVITVYYTRRDASGYHVANQPGVMVVRRPIGRNVRRAIGRTVRRYRVQATQQFVACGLWIVVVSPQQYEYDEVLR